MARGQHLPLWATLRLLSIWTLHDYDDNRTAVWTPPTFDLFDHLLLGAGLFEYELSTKIEVVVVLSSVGAGDREAGQVAAETAFVALTWFQWFHWD